MERVSKINYYLDIAQTVAERSTCLRKRFGAIIVKNDTIISTGYNGAPRGRVNCCDRKFCIRDQLNIPRGERYELCRSVHAEANAIIAASREQTLGATLYMACMEGDSDTLVENTTSCAMCKRLILNAGIETIIVRDTREAYRIIDTREWIVNDDSLDGTRGY
ncbi:MAG: dCMP deaminase family protein [Ruminococcaceae bacterium]|nr:dCMP deaminase family protein [Oscillospiraceae bacterium]